MKSPTNNDSIPEPVQSPVDFMAFINRMCDAHNWKVREVDDEHAVIEFILEKTRSQTLFVFSFEEEVEFSVPSFAAFESMDKVPHLISSSLLQINAKTKIGFWCMEHIGDKLVYTYMHNANITQLDEKNFSEIVTTLIQRVDEFENLLIKMSSEGNSPTEISQ